MTMAYFDCFAGAGGDMIVGALLDAGADFESLRSHLLKLPVGEVRLSHEKVRRGGIAGTQFHVETHDHHHHRGLKEILGLIEGAGLPGRVVNRARRIFQRLGQAEAKVHGIDVQEVHFHEVGAVDSILDIVGACVAMELLGVEEVRSSELPTGSGFVRTAHGVLPVPAPATAELLAGARIARTEIAGEALTPTAAAILTTLSPTFGPPPGMELSAVGYGAGTRDPADMPNLLRVLIGRGEDEGDCDAVVELACNLDDCSGQVLSAAMEELFLAGCLDAWAAPIHMKKSRPAYLLSVLCAPADVEKMEDVLFRETTTLGIRRHAAQRTKLSRRVETVETRYGPIRVKVGTRKGTLRTAGPEYADCRAAAQAHHVSLREVMQAALEAYRENRT